MMTFLFIAYIIVAVGLTGLTVVNKGSVGISKISHNPILTGLSFFGMACVIFPTQTDFVSKMIMNMIG